MQPLTLPAGLGAQMHTRCTEGKNWSFDPVNFVPGLVTVIVPTFNRAALLQETLESLERQVYRPLQVVVVDDGSTDGTPKVLSEFEKSQTTREFSVICLRQDNAGACAARNMGLAYAKGEYIQFLDSDDVLDARKIMDGVGVLAGDETVDFVYCRRADFSTDRSTSSPWAASVADLQLRPCVTEVVLRAVSTPLPLFRRSIVGKTGPWNERLTAFQDWEYIGRAAYHAKQVREIPKIQAYCRQHTARRLSVTPYGDRGGLIATIEAAHSLARYVEACNSPRRGEAGAHLADMCISAVRVALATGQAELARDFLQLLHGNDFLRAFRPNTLALWTMIAKGPSWLTKPALGSALHIWRSLGRLSHSA